MDDLAVREHYYGWRAVVEHIGAVSTLAPMVGRYENVNSREHLAKVLIPEVIAPTGFLEITGDEHPKFTTLEKDNHTQVVCVIEVQAVLRGERLPAHSGEIRGICLGSRVSTHHADEFLHGRSYGTTLELQATERFRGDGLVAVE